MSKAMTIYNLDRNSMNILDLPDEMLCTILNKLNMIDILYSLVDVNERFDRLALHPFYIHHLNLVIDPSIKHYCSSIDDQVLERICRKVLPHICNDIYQLTIEPLSLERALSSANYPHLHSLSLVNFPAEILLSQLTDDTKLVRLLTDQITQLYIESYVNRDKSTDRRELDIFAILLSVSEQLCDLTFRQYILKNNSKEWTLNLPKANYTSSTLTKLDICVQSFDDCLYLLDGRFENLSTLMITITSTLNRFSGRGNIKRLPQLTCFSLALEGCTLYYDEQIVPLLRRMSNLKELTLFLTVARLNSTFIDGKQLHNDFLSSMTRLEKFSFSIHTQLINKDTEIHLPSSNDLRKSFFEFGYKNIDVFGDMDFVNHRADSHIYSVPYKFQHFYFMTSAFQGGKFDQVRVLTMYDRRPFEHRLFQIIARDLPFLRSLCMSNREGQQIKNHSDEYITFSHLCELSLIHSHSDYAKEFLVNENIALPRLTSLAITYETLETVTNSFTHHHARGICNRITDIYFPEPFVRPSNFHLYFPLL